MFFRGTDSGDYAKLLRRPRHIGIAVGMHCALDVVKEGVVDHIPQLIIVGPVADHVSGEAIALQAGDLGNEAGIECSVDILLLFESIIVCLESPYFPVLLAEG